MKRLLSALSMLLLCFLLCFVSNYYFVKKINVISGLLENCMEYIDTDKSEDISISIDECENEWEKDRKFFGILINHETLDSLGIKISKLKYILTTGNNELLKESIFDCLVLVDEILSQQHISIENIL